MRQKEEPTLLEFDPMEGDSDESGDESRGQQEEADGADAGASGARKVDKFKDPMAALKGASRCVSLCVWVCGVAMGI